MAAVKATARATAEGYTKSVYQTGESHRGASLGLARCSGQRLYGALRITSFLWFYI